MTSAHSTTLQPATDTVERSGISRVVRQLGADTAYVFAGFPIAVFGFVILITGFSVGIGTLVLVFVGVPVLAGTLLAARALADLQRLRLGPVLHLPRVRPYYGSVPPGSGFWRRLFNPIRQLQSWLDWLHGILTLIPSVTGFSLLFSWWSVAVAGTLYFFYDWALPHEESNQELAELLGMADTATNRIALNTAIGLFFLGTLPLIARVCALTEAWLARAMLSGIAELRGRIVDLEQQRAAAVSAEATALRRLERDIHDGPQQRLVRLAIDLGRAQDQVDQDPGAAKATIAEALTQTRETLDELRALSRGIAPPVLTDRGLASALAALAARSPVPVDLAVDPRLPRLAPNVELTAYFVAAEALANVAKHSRATGCWVTLAVVEHRLGLTVIDDGVGGAASVAGHGLAGLAYRVRANGGDLAVTSPAGGPTEVRAELPC